MADRHGSHDLEAIVAFADGELAGAELEAATTQVQDCGDCADLVADLRSLALADRQLATPGRPRDFQLTPADAQRLGRLGPEPLVMATRLGPDMTGTPTTHAAHDPELIAAAVDGMLEGPERLMADAWLAACATCTELHADLLAIASAERALPTPTRPRDLRLTPADAQRLRPRGFRAILAAIGSSRDAFSKPLAVGLTTLGLAGLLVGTVPSLGLGGATSAPLDRGQLDQRLQRCQERRTGRDLRDEWRRDRLRRSGRHSVGRAIGCCRGSRTRIFSRRVGRCVSRRVGRPTGPMRPARSPSRRRLGKATWLRRAPPPPAIPRPSTRTA